MALIALTFGVAGATALYLAAPNQRLTARAIPARSSAMLGGGGLATALAILLQVLGPATAVFSLLTLVMTALTALPFIAAALAPRKTGK